MGLDNHPYCYVSVPRPGCKCQRTISRPPTRNENTDTWECLPEQRGHQYAGLTSRECRDSEDANNYCMTYRRFYSEKSVRWPIKYSKSVQNQIYWYQFKHIQLLLVRQKNGSTGAAHRGHTPLQCGSLQWGHRPWRRSGHCGVTLRGDEGAASRSRVVTTKGPKRVRGRRQRGDQSRVASRGDIGPASGLCEVATMAPQRGRAPWRRDGPRVVVTWRLHHGRALS